MNTLSDDSLEYTICVALNPSKMSIKSPLSEVEKFNGEGGLTVEHWCNIVSDSFKLGEWTQEHKLIFAAQKLSGAASIWYQAIRSSAEAYTSWDQLKAGLLQRFGGNLTADIARLELSRLKWTESKDLEQHITAFTTLRSRLTDANQAELIFHFRQTLPSEYLSDSLRHGADTIEGVIESTRSLYASRRHGLSTSTHTSNVQQQQSYTGPIPMDIDVNQLAQLLSSLGVQTRQGERRSRGPKCFECGFRGHLARDCRKKGNTKPQRESYGQHPRQQQANYRRQFNQLDVGTPVDEESLRLAQITYQIEQCKNQNTGNNDEAVSKDLSGNGTRQ
jgi:hypothetical protein